MVVDFAPVPAARPWPWRGLRNTGRLYAFDVSATGSMR
jgi:hypothetical protein